MRGTGRRSPRAGCVWSRARAPEISRAKYGLPPEASATRTSIGRERLRRSRDRMRWCRAASDSGPSTSRSTLPGASARSRSNGLAGPSSTRLATTTPTRCGSRRNENSSARLEAWSIHCASSIAMTRGSARLRIVSTVRSALASVSGSAGSSASRSSSATSSACRCGAGRASRTSSKRPPTRSPRAANERSDSASAGRAWSTRYRRSWAARTASNMTVVLPMPGSPSTRSPTGPLGTCSAKRATAAASACASDHVDHGCTLEVAAGETHPRGAGSRRIGSASSRPGGLSHE